MSLFLSSVTKSSGGKKILLSANQHLVKQTMILQSSSSSSKGLPMMSSSCTMMKSASFSSTTGTKDKAPEVTHTKNTEQQQQQQPTRRRRKRRIAAVDGTVPSYKEFVHKFTVVTLYRDFLKAVNLMPHNKEELIEQVKYEFRSNQRDNDPFQVQRALADGKRRFQELQEMTGYKKQLDADSWLNIRDVEDPRGRVGEGWPWSK
ncbi:unnamed protein product [Cylindrotheca closterium]|uniref:Complex 1 LYR protein domain-containing protein n=1 Tax=Cylindrotheca closterium TaxID=2856 RepID=A0AAD2G3S2_9STRA|nr:unnamed protein product [Cylindrotheca closterium]